MQEADGKTCGSPDAKRRIIVAGGGYAGTTVAVKLGRALRADPDVEIMLVEPNPCQQSLSELDLVAVGPPRPEFCELWHATVFKDLPVTVCYNRVDSVNADRHTISVGPRGGKIREVPYWRLVIATGAVAFVPPVPGLAENSTTMWSVDDAKRLQRRGDAQLRLAATLTDHAERARALSFTVIGGGATGVEIVGTLGQRLPRRMSTFGLEPADLRVRLVEGRSDILYDLPEPLRERAKKRLGSLGVEVICGSMVKSVDPGVVHLANGSDIDAAVLVFCGGAKADPDAIGWGLESDPSGRLVTNEYCKAPAHDDVYVVGDVAAFRDPKTKRTLPMLAQFAIREAENTAQNILLEMRGEAPQAFVPNMHGEFVSVGPGWGVGWMFGMHVHGLFAIFMKRLTYAVYWHIAGGFKLAIKRTIEMLRMQR